MSLEKTVLDCGLNLEVDHIDGASVNTISMFVPYGSVSEKPGKEGSAHALEHCLDLQTDSFDNMFEFDEYSRMNYMETNADTAHLRTAYHTMGATTEPAIVRLSQMLQHATLPPEYVESEMKVVRREAVMTLDDVNEMHSLAVAHAMFKGAYGRSIAGYHDRLDFDADDLRKIYNRYYRLGKMTLIAVGNVDIDEVAALADQYFEPDPGWKLQVRNPEDIAAPLKSPATTGLIYRDAKNARIGVSYVADKQLREKHRENPEAFIIAVNMISRTCLYKLRYDQGISYDGEAGFTYSGPPGTWNIYGDVTVANDDVEKALHTFDDVFSRTGADYSDNDIQGTLRQFELAGLGFDEDMDIEERVDEYIDQLSGDDDTDSIEDGFDYDDTLSIEEVREAIDSIAAATKRSRRRAHITGSRHAVKCADYIIQHSDIA